MGKILKVWDCPEDSRTVGAYVSEIIRECVPSRTGSWNERV